MAAQPRADEGAATISLFEPSSTPFVFENRMYRLETWTTKQWERIPEHERPAGTLPHGPFLRFRIVGS